MSSLPLVASVPVVVAGATMLIPSGGKNHLFVVVYNPGIVNGVQKVLLVPFEAAFSKCDNSCLISVGDHPFISHSSYMGYPHARSELLNHVVQCLSNGSYGASYPPVSSALLAKIQSGYSSTKRVPRFIKSDWP